MTILKLSRIGDALGLILPNTLLSELKLKEDDRVQLTRRDDGFTVTILDPLVAEQADVLRTVRKKRRSALRVLAK